MSSPLVVSFGGGVNSAAMLIGMHERGIRPDLILFADTGGEKPETYKFLETMRLWCRLRGFPEILTVQNDGIRGNLENDCLVRKTLPPIVMGWRTCSDKFKRRPIMKYLKLADSLPCEMAVGIDAEETGRLGDFDTDVVTHRYFLVDWGWGRRDCVHAIQRAGLPVPVKSACFFCPSSKKHEVLALKQDHPDLFGRAVSMERNAEGLHSIRGLGRHWSWEELAQADESQAKLFPADAPAIPCMCYDGESEEP